MSATVCAIAVKSSKFAAKIHHNISKRNRPFSKQTGGFWRRKRDLNPRGPFEPYSLSRAENGMQKARNCVDGDSKQGNSGGIAFHRIRSISAILSASDRWV